MTGVDRSRGVVSVSAAALETEKVSSPQHHTPHWNNQAQRLVQQMWRPDENSNVLSLEGSQQRQFSHPFVLVVMIVWAVRGTREGKHDSGKTDWIFKIITESWQVVETMQPQKNTSGFSCTVNSLQSFQTRQMEIFGKEGKCRKVAFLKKKKTTILWRFWVSYWKSTAGT